jgi:putative ABC transport system permease protein
MILKTLGATRGRIIRAYALEYALIGAIAACFGLMVGAAAGWAISSRAMNIPFVLEPAGAVTLAAATVLIAIVFGLVGTLRILAKKPASYLRAL